MTEPGARTLNHFACCSFRESFWRLKPQEREELGQGWLSGLRESAARVHLYQVFPAESGTDILLWSALPAEKSDAARSFFSAFARATNPVRAYVEVGTTLWGYTRPSQYSRSRSAQEIDPFGETRKAYLIVYPFVKTPEWYLMSPEARQGMMNEHIRIGKQYEDITQLLLYSFGIQNQEFVVVYETDDLVRFSDLVSNLRNTEARKFTERDTPLHTAVYHPGADALALWA